MGDIGACRACLAMDVVLYPIVNLYTQEVYQHLTNLSFESTEGKPQCLCYECYSIMRRCVEFRDKCLRADGVLNQLICSQMLTAESVSMIDRHIYNLTSNLICAHIETINSEPTYSCDVKAESDPNKDMKDHKKNLLTGIMTFDEKDLPWSQASIGDMTAGQKHKKLEIKPDPTPHQVIQRNKTVLVKNLKMELQNDSGGFETIREEVDTEFEGVSRSDSEDDLPLTCISRSQEKAEKQTKSRTVKKSGNRVSSQKTSFYAKEVTLTREDQLAEMKERATSTNYLHSQFKCEMCFKGFIEETAFRKHLDKHNESRGAYRCDVCALRYATSRQLRAHEISAHARQYHCLTCAHRSHTAHQAREHERWHRGFLYECKLCGKKFRKPTSHLTHMRKKHATGHDCLRCGDSFVGRRGLVVHNTKTHRDEEPVDDSPESERTCDQCNIVFLTVDACKRHAVNSVKHKDDTENSNACNRCSERFESAVELATHMSLHRAARARAPCGVRLTCSYCSNEFANKSKLQAHIRRVHLGLKFNKNIVCELCGKRCTSNATLRYHQRTHTGERPYPCRFAGCARRFADSNQLRIHARTHSGERPYRCLLCTKAFRQKPALNRHMRVHTGAKPYGCQYCAKTFSQSNSLKLHIRTVHFKLPSNNRRNKIQTATAVC